MWRMRPREQADAQPASPDAAEQGAPEAGGGDEHETFMWSGSEL